MRDFGSLNITDASRGAAITVTIIPKANRTEIVGVQEDGTIRIRLMAPPVEGEDNAELIRFLSGFFGVNPADIEIIAGANSRNKLVTILNVRAEEIEEKVRASTGPGFVAADD